MTERHSGYLVALDHDIREDDAEAILNAIRMIKGVQSVQPVPAGAYEASIAEQRRDDAWREGLLQLVKGGPTSE
ncbi:hypothetical protein [Actinomadura madurae]|uniref:hypothetical protein n=1 Tax=Actinomadura madurae TaxID=1993 RepID=UPI0020D1F650|nr:hypothetical protein [Actinomadura madurae]MCP9947236.1 hypothetical protein [Actinomadura madurae]MCP9964000.1 hypothetical protein [Actinomadura madurae]MCP9976475.1 hypothetical protein [Actinomadura madurae]MCQ0012031.1 hypothetical protein [Actinomadura madurae]MCQ0012667.1 hypothetical protein [Actinomadura madurae]